MQFTFQLDCLGCPFPSGVHTLCEHRAKRCSHQGYKTELRISRECIPELSVINSAIHVTMNACNHRRTQYGVMRDNGERGQAAKHLQTLNLESGQFTYPILAAELWRQP